METVKRGELTIKSVAKELKVSYRQGRRIYAAYCGGGDAALIHGNIGKESGRKIEGLIREAALKAYREKYYDFGPMFAAEKLADSGRAVGRQAVKERASRQAGAVGVFRRTDTV